MFVFNHGNDTITCFTAEVDQIEIAAHLMGDADLEDMMSVQDAQVVIDFDGGHSLTIRSHDTIETLLNDISFV